MQDIDFGKAYRKRPNFAVDGASNSKLKRPKANSSEESGKSHWGSRITFGSCIFIVAFTIGLVFGMRFQKQRIADQIDDNIESSSVKTANTNPAIASTISKKECTSDQTYDEELNRCIKNNAPATLVKKATNETAFIILGKVYPDKRMAYKSGLALKKKGLPVFLAESGNRMKLYVGPVKGKTQAYNMLAQVKKMPEFRGAILYKK